MSVRHRSACGGAVLVWMMIPAPALARHTVPSLALPLACLLPPSQCLCAVAVRMVRPFSSGRRSPCLCLLASPCLCPVAPPACRLRPPMSARHHCACGWGQFLIGQPSLHPCSVPSSCPPSVTPSSLLSAPPNVHVVVPIFVHMTFTMSFTSPHLCPAHPPPAHPTPFPIPVCYHFACYGAHFHPHDHCHAFTCLLPPSPCLHLPCPLFVISLYGSLCLL